MKNKKAQELEDRLIDFSVGVLNLTIRGTRNQITEVLYKQLTRSGTSTALNYAEARAAESSKDFIHKMKVGLKELRETYVCLKILDRTVHDIENSELISEANELISIFVASIRTAKGGKNSDDKV